MKLNEHTSYKSSSCFFFKLSRVSCALSTQRISKSICEKIFVDLKKHHKSQEKQNPFHNQISVCKTDVLKKGQLLLLVRSQVKKHFEISQFCRFHISCIFTVVCGPVYALSTFFQYFDHYIIIAFSYFYQIYIQYFLISKRSLNKKLLNIYLIVVDESNKCFEQVSYRRTFCGEECRQ